MTQQDLDKIFAGFSATNVLVVGDIMIDAYLWGKVDRISPEAPVPVVSVTKKEYRLGGAANVALNLKALGANPIICGTYGDDEAGTALHRLFIDNQLSTSGLVQTQSKPTTVKTRVISAGQHMLRIDEELDSDITSETEKHLIGLVTTIFDQQKIDVVIFEDYNKGLLTETIIQIGRAHV